MRSCLLCLSGLLPVFALCSDGSAAVPATSSEISAAGAPTLSLPLEVGGTVRAAPTLAPARSGMPVSRLSVRTFEFSYDHATLVLGTSEMRAGGTVGVEWAEPSRLLAFRGRPDVIAQETIGVRFGRSHNDHEGVNTLMMQVGGRWTGAGRTLNNVYFEIGTGIALTNETTIDLSSHLNLATYAGIGLVSPTDRAIDRVGIRFLHLSNGGTNRPNRGMNFIQATLGIRY